jgi:magnesium transporter
MGLIQKVKNKNFTWVNISKPNTGSIEYLKQNYKFHPLDLEDCSNPTLRAKLDEYDDYLFIILNYPIFNRKTRRISLSEVDIFIGKDYLITLSDGNLTPLNEIFESCQLNNRNKEKYFNEDVTFLLYEILNSLQKYCFPILDHVSHDLRDIEKQIFDNREKQMVREILITKRNIVNYRKSVQSHKNVIKKLGKMSHKDFMKDQLNIYFANTLDQAKEIWEILENLKENVEAVHNTNESLISFKLNQAMKVLTVISVILLPATLLASIFGMNYLIPFQKHPLGFWFAGGIMIFCMFALWIYFKKKKWMD